MSASLSTYTTAAEYRVDQAAWEAVSMPATTAGLHPVMAEVMAMHCGMDVTPAPQAHYPEVGRRRPDRRLGDAMAYEAGWLSYSPDAPAPAVRTPFADGWWDAFAASERDAECALGLDCIDEERDDDR